MHSGSETSRNDYTAVAKVLHWVIAGAIVVQFVLAKLAEAADDEGAKFRELVLLANHKSVGITILALVVVRLAWRIYRPPPAPVPMPNWQRTASTISHWSFYALLFVIPISGWLMSSASNISVSWFNLFQLPDFVAPEEGLEALFEETHETLVKVLFALAVIHILAALKHTFIDRDRILRRITSPLAIIAFVVVIVAGVLMLTPASRADDGVPPSSWQIDYSKSHIRFTAEQAGADFDGEWREWCADLRFDPERLESSSFDVSVNVASVDTLDKERDETLQEPEWFDGTNHPQVFYRAREFSSASNASFAAAGEIAVKGLTTPAEFRFDVDRRGNRIVLDGAATLDRLRMRVGTGEWEDTAWIGQFVDVAVHVEATVD